MTRAEAQRRGDGRSDNLVGWLIKSVDGTDDAIAQKGFAKVEQIAELQAGQFQIGLDLFAVGRTELGNGLEFEDHAVGDDEVGAKAFVEGEAVVGDGDRNLTPHGEAAFLEFVGEDGLVNGFEQAGAEAAVNVDGGVENDLTDFVLVHGCLGLGPL